MMVRRLLQCRLWRDRRGTSVIEFAFVAPVLAVMALGIADLSRGLGRKYQLEQASYRALELVTVGTLGSQSQATDYAFVKTEAAAAANVPADNVTVATWLECNGTKQDFDTVCTNPAHQSARFLTVTIVDDFKPTFTYGPLGGTQDGKVRLTARSTIRMQ